MDTAYQDQEKAIKGVTKPTSRMAQKSLSELKNCHSGTSKPVPYSDGVTVVVVKKGHTAKFLDSNGQQGELLNFSVADKSASMLATLSDKTKHSKIVEGKTFLVRNFILKGGKITMSSKTSIMGKPSLEIPDEIRTSAVQLILPPSPEKKVAEVHTAPLRSICSVKGQVIKNEATRTVRVSGSETTIRTITIEENRSTIEITLWRELAELAINIGDTLQITHCLLNEWQGTKALNTTRNTTIQEIQPLEANVSGTVQALSLTETSWEVCLKEDNKEQYRDIVIEKDMMQNALSHIDEACLLTEEELENVLINRIPFKLQAVMMGSRILNLQLGILPAQQIPHPQFEKME